MLIEDILPEELTDENKTLSDELNDENLEGLHLQLDGLKDIIRYDKSWTISTIYDLVQKGMIDLEPDYQRRNVWSDLKKTELIESIILNYPIPKLIFMENPEKRNHFIVVDGKQRLLTIMGFINPSNYPTWTHSKLQVSGNKGLRIRKELKDKDISFFNENPDFGALFFNASISCEVISRVTPDLIYDIFYRLNSGAEPLNFQELRFALFRGKFSKFLTNTMLDSEKPFQKMIDSVLKPQRMEDVEILLRLFGIFFLADKYTNSLKDFLDLTMKTINDEWEGNYDKKVPQIYDKINAAITNLILVFGDMKNVSRLPNSKLFNKALFEVQVFYFTLLESDNFTPENIIKFKEHFEKECSNPTKVKSFSLGTNSTSNFKARFELFKNIVNHGFGSNIKGNPFEK